MLQLGMVTVLLTVGQIGTAVGDRERRFEIASAWAPILFHDEAREFTQFETGFNPIDTPVGFFFDGNEDLRDNGRSIFRLSTEQVEQALGDLPLYFSLIETPSHFYLNYIVYHAIDGNRVGHVHDTENIFVVIEKNQTPYGQFVAAITNAHGFPMIYTDDLEVSENWTKKFNLSREKDFLPLLDRFSKDQHERGTPEWIERSGSKSLKVFVSSQSHAIYKFNTDAWLENEMNGSVYYPRSCGECRSFGARPYQLVDFDQMMETAMSTPRDKLESFVAKFRRESLQSHFYQERKLPGYLAAGIDERSPKANLFFGTSFKSPYPLSDPASLHEFLVGSFSKKISNIYTYNPYLEPRSIASKPRSRRASQDGFWGIALRIMDHIH